MVRKDPLSEIHLVYTKRTIMKKQLQTSVSVMCFLFFSGAIHAQPCAPTAACNLGATVSTSGATCSSPTGSATVNVIGGTAPYAYVWSPNVSSTNSAGNLMPGNYSVTITDAGGSVQGPQLVVNGDFSAGNTGFTSSYGNCNSSQCLWPDKLYAIGSNPQFFHTQFWGSDHTTGTGNFMIINGSSVPNVDVWTETIAVTPNTKYVFSTWLSAMNTISAAQLQFSINGSLIGNIFTAPAQINQWIQFCAVWNSGSNTSATISIINQSTVIYGNDFALDDISFRGILPCSTSVAFTIQPSSSFSVTASAFPASCGSQNGSASASVNGGATPYTYLWLTNPSQTTSSINNLSGGIYSVIVADANGCTQQQNVTVASGGNSPSAGFSTSAVSADPGNTVFDLTNTSIGATTWAWDFGDGSTSSLENPPSHTYSDTGTFCITLIVTSGNAVCADTTVHCVNVEGEFSFYIPNAFTPNGDFFNEQFFGKGRGIKEYTVHLFDRWGNLIWNCHQEGYRKELDEDHEEGLSSVCKWDGTVTNKGADLNGSSGQLVQEDVYVWKVALTDIFNKEHKYIGHVSVVK